MPPRTERRAVWRENRFSCKSKKGSSLAGSFGYAAGLKAVKAIPAMLLLKPARKPPSLFHPGGHPVRVASNGEARHETIPTKPTAVVSFESALVSLSRVRGCHPER